MSIQEKIDDELGEIRKFGHRQPKYLVVSPCTRAKLLRIDRAQRGGAVEADPKDGSLKYRGLLIAVLNYKPEPFFDIV